MTYVRWIEDDDGNAIDVETYCDAHAPADSGAWPCWDAEAYCHECGTQLRLGEGR